MIDTALLGLTASVAFGIGIAVERLVSCHHRFDDGTDRFNILPHTCDSDKLGINRTTVYRCQEESCHAEETETEQVKAVSRDEFERAIDEMTRSPPRR